MELTQESLEAVAAKLAPHIADLSADERALLNDVFNLALRADDAEVSGFGLDGPRTGTVPTTRPGGGSTPPTPPVNPGTGKPSAPFDPATIKFFV